MKALVFLLLLAVVSAKLYEQCELVKALKKNGLDWYQGISLANWVCLAKHGSNFNTKAINHNSDGSTGYGIFQINNRWWCNNEKFQNDNACKICCSQLLTDDISKAAECAKVIVKQGGIAAWETWTTNCQGKDLNQYIEGCDDSTNLISIA